MKKIVVGIGEILWDVFPDRRVLGGAPANFACHVSQLGLDGYAVSAIGRDELGEDILRNLAHKPLKTHLARTDQPTGTVHVTLDASGVPHYVIDEQVAWDYLTLNPQTEELARQTHAVTFGSLAQRNEVSRLAINRFLDLMPSSSYRIFDINLRQHFYTREIIHQSLLRSTILKINEEELVVVSLLFYETNLTEMEACERLLKDYALEMVVLTKGENGSSVYTNRIQTFLETPKVLIADTVGAGDSFTAAFMAAMLSGKSIQDAHRLAVDVSAFVCTQRGAMPTLPARFLKVLAE